MEAGERGVLSEGVFKAASMGEEEGEVEADDLLVAGLVGGSVSDGLVEVAEGVVVGCGFELAESSESHGGDGGGDELEEMGEGIDGGGVLIGAVLEDAEVPPAFLPAGVEALGFSVELNGEGEVLLVAGGGGSGGDVGESGGGFLRGEKGSA